MSPTTDLSKQDGRALEKIQRKAERATKAANGPRQKRLAPLRHRALGAVTRFPSAAPEPPELTFLPSHLRRAMLLFKLRVVDLVRLFGHSRFEVHRWLNGTTPIPLGIAQYFQLRVNELIRAYAHGVGFGLISDVDQQVQRGATSAQRERLQQSFSEQPPATGPAGQP